MEIITTGVKVLYSKAETLRKWLLGYKVIDSHVSFSREKDYLIIPLTLKEEEAKVLLSSFGEENFIEIGQYTFIQKDFSPRNLTEILVNHLPESLHSFIPKAFDVVGDIAIIEIPFELQSYKNLIGASLKSLFPSISTVYRKASPVSGELRIRDLELIAGEQKCSTIHLEYGVRIFVDICKSYFSPRLGHEHHRVSNEIKDKEVVLDFFAGVGPFALHIAKRCDSLVYAIDINDFAIRCLEESMKLNKFKGKIIPVLGDCRQVAESLPKGDRVIMNLPGKAQEFLDIACNKLNPQGIIYFYQFINTENAKDDVVKIVEKRLKKVNKKIREVVGFHKVRESAPKEVQVCLEFSIEDRTA
ncbi:MAG: class I SAM-dependent methyltransferase [Candidatus Heimdallarchaeaceae archaeon]